MDLGRRSIVEWAESAPEEGGSEFVPAQEKFSVETSIGQGGMADVFLVTDQDLKRQVAMKIQRASGSLFIARHAPPGRSKSGSYEVSYRESKSGDFAIVAGTRERDWAWARLVFAARAITIAYTTEMPSEVYSERALHRLQGLEKDGW